MVRYTTAEPGHVSVLRIGAHVLGRAEWSRRRYTDSTFWEDLDFPDLT
jgi:hypothetical protein